ncbi:unnamed protein product, partial [Meganyctiphanes norvegica]
MSSLLPPIKSAVMKIINFERTSVGSNIIKVESSVCSFSSTSSGVSDSSGATSSGSCKNIANFSTDVLNLDFKIIVEQKCAPPIVLHLVAPTMQEKQAWISDISQVLDNVHFNNLFRSSLSDTSSVTMPHLINIKNDPKLFRDDVDIRFSTTLNSCKVPHIRYATPDRLLERLTDLRFLSIDFLNTFLLTYRVFTDGVTVLDSLKKVYYNTEVPEQTEDSRDSSVERHDYRFGIQKKFDQIKCASAVRAADVGPMFEEEQREQEENNRHDDLTGFDSEGANTNSGSTPNSPFSPKKVTIKTDDANQFLKIPAGHGGGVGSSSSAETLTGEEPPGSQAESPSDTSTSTLVPSSPTDNHSDDWRQLVEGSDRLSRSRKPTRRSLGDMSSPPRASSIPRRSLTSRMSSLEEKPSGLKIEAVTSGSEAEDEPDLLMNPRRRSTARSFSSITSSGFLQVGCGVRRYSKRVSESEFSPRSSVHTATPRSSFQVPDSPQHSSPRVGVVITSFRQSQRRSSSASAAAAFAVATAGSSNPRDLPKTPQRFSLGSGEGRRSSFRDRPRQESIISTAATMRVLNVLRHWVSKHSQDFDTDLHLRQLTIEFLEDLVCCPTLLPAEHKAASQLLRLLTKEDSPNTRHDLTILLQPPQTPCKENIESLSALDVAEQMTYIDHQIFINIRSEEFLNNAWMKKEKDVKAPYILLITKRFNEVSRLVASEIIRGSTQQTRITIIEKWVAVADICRCLHNYNGVLQVCAAFQNSSVFRLKKTWEKVSKTTRQTLDKLQTLVTSDGRFRSLRDALHRCDPPCIPYLGMYLTDLTFIDEGTPTFTDDDLLNFSKMRMIAHVIREIRHFQQTPYKIEYNNRVASYLLDTSLILSDEDQYRLSLDLEPRRSTICAAMQPPAISALSSASSSSSS